MLHHLFLVEQGEFFSVSSSQEKEKESETEEAPLRRLQKYLIPFAQIKFIFILVAKKTGCTDCFDSFSTFPTTTPELEMGHFCQNLTMKLEGRREWKLRRSTTICKMARVFAVKYTNVIEDVEFGGV